MISRPAFTASRPARGAYLRRFSWPILAGLFCALLAGSLYGESRTWRNQKGKKLDADLVGVEGEDALLAKPGEPDVQIRYPMSELGEKDRDYIAAWRANRESFVGKMLWGNLVKAKAVKDSSSKKKKKGDDDNEDKKPSEEVKPGEVVDPATLFTKLTEIPGTKIKYYVLYFSGKWSPHDRRFTPKLVTFYKGKSPKTPKSTTGSGLDWEVVLVSADRSAVDMAAYMREFDMPWPGLDYTVGRTSPLVRFRGDGLPCVVVLDTEGKVLIDSFATGKYRAPDELLGELDALISDGPEGLARERVDKEKEKKLKAESKKGGSAAAENVND